MSLTVSKIQSLDQPGRYGDRPGSTLFLLVSRGGSRSWVQRLVVRGRRRDIGLGGWPLVSLEEARAMAFENRKRARQGHDPLAERRQRQADAIAAAAVPTFEEAARQTYEAKRPEWKNGSHPGWLASLENHAFPILGPKRVDEIDTADVLAVLNPIWSEIPETSRRVRSRIRAVLARCASQGYVRTNAAGEALDGGLTRRRPGSKKHFRSLPWQEIPEALKTIAASNASDSAKLALRFLVLTAARTSEVLHADWREIDLEAKTWIVPAERMKAGREHRVPLSDPALAVLDEARRLTGGQGLLFPSPRKPGVSLSNMTLLKLLRDSKVDGTVHGFRAGFRSWAEETGRDDHAAEQALAHTVGGVRGAYLRTTVFDKRIALMAAWGAVATGEEATVVELRRLPQTVAPF